MTEETTPQKARRLAKEWASQWFDKWPEKSRKWLRFAFTKGYQACCEEQAAEVGEMDDAIAQWEEDGDAEALVNALDAWLERIEARAGIPSGEAAA